MKKIDIHVHSIKRRGILRYTGDTFATASELVEMYDQLGIEKGVLLPLISPEAQIELSGNQEVQDIAEMYPDRFYWFCNIDPRQLTNTSDADLKYILNYYQSCGAKGVGEITANIDFDDPMTMNLFRCCEECGMPVTFHIGKKGGEYGLIDEKGLPKLEKVLKAFPKLLFLGHSTRFWAEISGNVTAEELASYPQGKVTPGGRVVELMRKYPNLYGDLSAGSGVNSMVRDPEFACAFMEEFQDRLCYGTDICSPNNMNDLRVMLPDYLEQWREKGMISQEICEKILYRNALKILEK